MKTMIDRLYRWNFWGNRRTLGMMRSNGGGTSKMLELMSHILASERVWLTRLEGRDSTGMEIFPAFDLEDCVRFLDENERDWSAYLATLDHEKMFYLLNYTNQSGKSFESAVADILLHVSSHGHYHRGQINSQAREAGWLPEYTDYIAFTRENKSKRT